MGRKKARVARSATNSNQSSASESPANKRKKPAPASTKSKSTSSTSHSSSTSSSSKHSYTSKAGKSKTEMKIKERKNADIFDVHEWKEIETDISSMDSKTQLATVNNNIAILAQGLAKMHELLTWVCNLYS